MTASLTVLRTRTSAAVRSQPLGAWLTGLAAFLVYTVFSVTQWNRLAMSSWSTSLFSAWRPMVSGSFRSTNCRRPAAVTISK